MMVQFSEKDARQYSPLALAFLGDSVYETLVRTAIVAKANTSAKHLHTAKIQLVCAAFQARAAQLLLEQFTEEERAVYLRGRNASGNTVPHSASAADYRKATGLEAVFGYLHLMGNTERLETLFTAVWEQQETILLEMGKES